MSPILPRPLALRRAFVAQRTAEVAVLAAVAGLIVGAALYSQVGDARAVLRDEQVWREGRETREVAVEGWRRDSFAVLHSYRVSVFFPDDQGRVRGGLVEFETLFVEPRREDDPVVRYDPSDPARFALSSAVDCAEGRWLGIGSRCFFWGIGGLFLWGALHAWRRLGALRALAAGGVETPVTVLSATATEERRGVVTYRFHVNAAPGLPPSAVGERTCVVRGREPLVLDASGATLLALVSPRHPTVPVVVGADLWPFDLDEEARAAVSRELLARGLPRPLGGWLDAWAIRRALKLLRRLEAEGALPSPEAGSWFEPPGSDGEDPVIAAQTLARQVVGRYGLAVGTVVVTFRSDLPSAGRVELGGEAGFFVEAHAGFKGRPRQLAAILGHEVAHIFLHRHGVHLEDRYEMEVTTDVAAVLWGFGPLMLEGYRETEQRTATAEVVRLLRSTTALGYLSPEEVAYLVEVQGQGSAARSLARPEARRAFRRGRRRARAERSSPPLRAARPWGRLRYLVDRGRAGGRDLAPAGAPYRFEGGKVVFRCWRCHQQLRLPTGRSLAATCPNCRTGLDCRT